MTSQVPVIFLNSHSFLTAFLKSTTQEIGYTRTSHFYFKLYFVGIVRKKFSLLPILIPDFTQQINKKLWFRFVRTAGCRNWIVRTGWFKLPGFFSKTPLLRQSVRSKQLLYTSLNTKLKKQPPRLLFFIRRLDHIKLKLPRTPGKFNDYRVLSTFATLTVKNQHYRVSGFGTNHSLNELNSTPHSLFIPTRGLGRLYTGRWLREFRVQTSRFLRIDTKRAIINYNLKGTKTRLTWLRGNFFLRNTLNCQTAFRFAGRTILDSLQPSSIMSRGFKYSRRRRLFFLRVRRITTFWVSKITQRTLTPTRREFNKLYLKKPLKYQKRITLAVLKYYRFKVLEVLYVLEFTLLNILTRSRLVLSRSMAVTLINLGFVTVNGFRCADETSLVYPLDWLMLEPSLRFILFYKWALLSVFFTGRKFFIYFTKVASTCTATLS